MGLSSSPLTDSCEVGDVVVLILPHLASPPSSTQTHTIALSLAVVDGEEEATLLCLREEGSKEWYRDNRQEPLRGLTSAVLVQVVCVCVCISLYLKNGFDSGIFFGALVCFLIYLYVAFACSFHTHSFCTYIYTQVIDQAGYSQRNIPSLGGGVGYGAEAEDCWFIDEDDIPDGVLRPLDSCFTAPWMY